ncbi:hypothetical protein [Neobacillus sp. D3-1R]|uniref:hypothetical protein n=1 Tax=Neobacillus sp. D3-1R TaxID=3445778 RepID=UPI003FA17A03
MTKSYLSNFYKFTGILGGILFFLFGVIFAYSHGTTPQNRMLPIFGLDQAVVLTAIAFLFYICLGITLISLNKYVLKNEKIDRFSHKIVLVSIVFLLVSLIMQNVLVDPHTEWNTPIAIIGWLLQNLSWFLFTVGMVILGIKLYRNGSFRLISLLTILLGLLAALTILGDLMIYRFSNGSITWDLIQAIKYLPFSIIWILLVIHISRLKN